MKSTLENKKYKCYTQQKFQEFLNDLKRFVIYLNKRYLRYVKGK